MNQEPLSFFYNKFGYHAELIKRFGVGEKYSIIELTDGNCGVCGLNKPNTKSEIPTNIDLNNYSHRTLYTCYLNALLNNKQKHLSISSFPEQIENGKYHNIVMIGLFRPLLKRFQTKNITPVIFDINKNENCITPIHKINKELAKADLVILSATTIVNNTFTEIIANTNKKALINIAEPTTIMHSYMENWINKGVISGMVFSEELNGLFETIMDGHGTQQFKIYGKKVDFRINC